MRTTITPSVMLRTVADSMIILRLGCYFSYNVNEFYKNLPKFLVVNADRFQIYVRKEYADTWRSRLEIAMGSVIKKWGFLW